MGLCIVIRMKERERLRKRLLLKRQKLLKKIRKIRKNFSLFIKRNATNSQAKVNKNVRNG